MGKQKVKRVFRPEELFTMLGIKKEGLVDAEKVFKFAFDFLNYMSVGDELHTTNVIYKKTCPDNVYLDTELDLAGSIDTLDKKRIIVIGY